MIGTDKPLLNANSITDIFSDYGDCVTFKTLKHTLYSDYIWKEHFVTLLPKELNILKIKIKIDGVSYETL